MIADNLLAFLIRTDRCGCLRRPIRMSAPTDTDVCTDRYGCLRRPIRMSAPTDANVCADRCGCLHRPTRIGGLNLL
ncbi:hypothetical protein [Leyella stercorea]